MGTSNLGEKMDTQFAGIVLILGLLGPVAAENSKLLYIFYIIYILLL